jgi:hypothetical protein
MEDNLHKNDEYVIINKTAILKKIEELKAECKISEANGDKIRAGIEHFEAEAYEAILKQSKPLIFENDI